MQNLINNVKTLANKFNANNANTATAQSIQLAQANKLANVLSNNSAATVATRK